MGSLILLLDSVFTPRPIQRESAVQAGMDRATANLVLYQFEACPFCVKVRRAIRRLNLKIEKRDIKKFPTFSEELLKGGGQRQVPCLRITAVDGSQRWLYESSDIVAFLETVVPQ